MMLVPSMVEGSEVEIFILNLIEVWIKKKQKKKLKLFTLQGH